MSENQHQSTFQAPDVEEVARLFPGYQVHTLIACGGMGAVYQATQRSLDRIVAIKILPREFSTDAAFRAGFESEAKAMAKLNHPNLIGVYDFGEAEGMLFIVMEYVAGKSLFHSAHGFAVDQSEAIPIVAAICRGLAHAHENGVLHRDIKPSNVLLDANANPKIGDFGLARALEREIEEGEQIFGTPGYTAPEVLEPPFAIDQRADIFSVGVLLHELLTGKLPDSDPRSASQISGCSRQVDPIIFRALHPDPNFRYMSASEMADDLEKISRSGSRALLTAPKPASGTPLAKPGKALVRPAMPAAKPAAAPAALGSPKPPSALAGPKPLSGRPALSPRPLGVRTGPQVSAKESSAMPLILISLLVVVVVIAVVVLNKKSPPPPEAGAPPVPEAPAPPVEAAPGNEDSGEASTDPTVALRNARSSISHRVEPLFEAYERDLEANADDPGKKKALDDKLAADLKSQAGIYVLELQNQIEQLSKAGEQAAIDALEEEVRRVESDPGYFRSAMQR